MQTVSQRELNQQTAAVLDQVTDTDDVIVTERGKPRWRVTAVRESGTTLARLEREGRYPPFFDRVGLLEISRETRTVAESMERHVKTLDALHLATALVIGEPVTVATHDKTMKVVAGHLGPHVIDPVEPPSH
ncbi:type II toxin-antitoxin system prevent-host-death family antitoxin [Arthrobacter sp.]|uniref:type II toxin-antitoxin system prevent-host-death family antitoxin n=1 Tax=Arthrobacter sp. TaxID=1667 RepID=UPI003A958755